ncbi:MAG TPA: NADH-quinone oxidoreductase subunit N [Thermoanaerobaculia bacterium]|jgi:NADH-quinone oxidoreductase subunit N|nr:NADH-quinone oxidoreductase subunit N [Thermoanaerobaculia bacterium]
MNDSFVHFTHADLLSIAPEIALLVAGCLILLVEAFAPALRRWFATIALAGVAVSLYFLVNAPAGTTFGGRYDTSPLTVFVGLFLGAAAVLAILVSRPYLERAGEERGEFYALLLWGHLGVSLMTRGLDLILIFIGLETLSLAFYVLAGFFRRVAASSEAGLKYFLTGAFGSAFTLYGIALLFGASGGTKLEELVRPGLGGNPAVAFGLLFLLVGFGFKMSLAPFHAWAPDVYQGMPTPAVAYLSVAPKGAALLVLFRVFSAVFQDGLPDRFRAGLAALAILSMTLGNVVALAQRDAKRLLAYSGIAQMGYVTIALVVFGRDALAAALVYFCAYLVSNAGAFAAVSALYRDETKAHPVALLAGAGRRAPFAAAVFALCLFSLAGIPATAGFIGKFFLFKAALEKGFYALALIGVANSLVSIGYYLKVVYILYMRDPVETEAPPALALADRLALALCAAGILAIGIFPSTVWEVARHAAATLPFAGP